jgi:hypothetical protein
MSNTATGKVLETFVVNLLLSSGYNTIPYSNWKSSVVTKGKHLIRHYPYVSIYGSGRSQTEFVIQDDSRMIRVECKWQQVSGSVDEKLPYLYMNAVESFPEKEIILLIDGGGFKPGAISWINKKTAEYNFSKSDKKIKVMTMMEFQIWVNKKMPAIS